MMIKYALKIVLSVLVPAVWATAAIAGPPPCSCQAGSRIPAMDALLANPAEPEAVLLARHLPYGGVKFRYRDRAGYYAGLPPQVRRLTSDDFVVFYDELRRVPRLTAHRLDKARLVDRERKNCFRPDPRLGEWERAVCADYAEHRFDQGHMVPRADMNYAEEAMLNTFVLSNMAPQFGAFNREIWRALEVTVRDWARANGRLTVFTGAIFDGDGDFRPDDESSAARMTSRDGSRRVAVPSHFYKVVLRETAAGPDVIAVLLPHVDRSPTKCDAMLDMLGGHLVTVSLIERMAGLRFFPDMPEPQAQAIKGREAPGLWPPADRCDEKDG